MADETAREIYRALSEAQSKYTYFLLAVAGAAIGLTVRQTQGLTLAWSQLPLAAAVMIWGLSFFFGSRNLMYVSSTLLSNLEMLYIESGQHPQAPSHPQLRAAAGEGIREAIEEKSKRANRLGRLQFQFLVAGAIFYVAWHVLEMYLRTLGAP